MQSAKKDTSTTPTADAFVNTPLTLRKDQVPENTPLAASRAAKVKMMKSCAQRKITDMFKCSI